MDGFVKSLIDELCAIDAVEAAALGGSRSGDVYDEKSDYDVYLYCTSAIPEDKRAEILSRYCGHTEIGNCFWEYEDNCMLNNGVDIDILYRDLDAFAAGISDVVDKHKASNGYTTCMWHNLKTCKILTDKSGRLTALKNKYDCGYPVELQSSIIRRNMGLLRYAMPAYPTQIEKAVKRGDTVSVNHRVTEFLASYFDVIFAVNKLTHPGEKRLINLCEKNCRVLPVDFRVNLDRLFSDMFTHGDSVADDIKRIVDNVEAVLP